MPKQFTHNDYVTKLAVINPNIAINENYVNSSTLTEHKCKICGHVWLARPRDVLRGHGCPVCSGRIVGMPPEYRNSIWASEYRQYFSQYLTEEQMQQYTPHSSARVEATCPDCGLRKDIIISNLFLYGLGCVCQDGVSFPNKFVFNAMQQLGVKIKPEYSPIWAKKRKYDIYALDYQLIIENHGEQHYSNRTKWNGARTLKEEQENDFIKYKLAIDNGIINYVVLDCRNSNKEWIKTSIMNSELPSLLCFKEDDINWDEALLYATTSLVKTSAELFNKGYHTNDIAKIIGRHRSTVCRWLGLAAQLGLCDYKPETEIMLIKSKKIRCVEINMIFDSIRKAAKFIGQSPTSIVNCLKGKTCMAGGYHWEYV